MRIETIKILNDDLYIYMHLGASTFAQHYVLHYNRRLVLRAVLRKCANTQDKPSVVMEHIANENLP